MTVQVVAKTLKTCGASSSQALQTMHPGSIHTLVTAKTGMGFSNRFFKIFRAENKAPSQFEKKNQTNSPPLLDLKLRKTLVVDLQQIFHVQVSVSLGGRKLLMAQ